MQIRGHTFYRLLFVSAIFAVVFSMFASPAEAVKPCNAPPEARSGPPFLIAGCPSVTIGGESIACYHTLSGVVFTVLQAYNLLLGVVGSLALLMFVWGGFQWLMSGGSEKRIQSGIATLRNAIIGILVVFGAWIGVNFIVSTLTAGSGKLAFTSAANQWYNIHKGALCYRALTASELASRLAKPAELPKTEEKVPILPRGACCYVTTGGVKTGERADLARCKTVAQEKLKKNEIKNDPIFHCTYTGGQDIETNKICWETKPSEGNRRIYCNVYQEISTSSPAPSTLVGRKGVCCVSDEDSTRGLRYLSYPLTNETYNGCLAYQKDWRLSGTTKGVFSLKFCPSGTSAEVCGKDTGTGWQYEGKCKDGSGKDVMEDLKATP